MWVFVLVPGRSAGFNAQMQVRLLDVGHFLGGMDLRDNVCYQCGLRAHFRDLNFQIFY